MSFYSTALHSRNTFGWIFRPTQTYDQALTEARRALGDAMFEREWRRDETRAFDELVQWALSD